MKKDEARKLLEKEEQERVDRVKKGIDKLLIKENCMIDVAMIITPKGNIPQINIVAKEKL